MSHKVYIVDDDAALRNSLALLLRSVELEAETFASAQAFLAAYPFPSPSVPCCLVTDVRMPAMSGLELQAQLRRCKCEIPIILLSGHADVPMAVRAMSAGAVSLLEKPVNAQALIDLIFKALAEQPKPDPRRKVAALDARRGLLSSRQRDVFDLLMQGLQTKQVAHRLNLSPRTVEVHRAKILERLQAPSFAYLISDLLKSEIPD